MSNELVKGGRYQIPPQGGGKPVPMTRVTNVAKALSDTEGLMKWAERMVAIGMARRPDLVATAASLDPVADKSALGDIARFAKRSAGDKVAAELGTAIHAATEAADLGEEVPAEFAERVTEYQRALAAAGIQIDAALIEVVLVLEDRKVAGTTDRLVTMGEPEHIVFDLKTGADVAYKQLEHCLQLTAYSRATSIFDPETGKHRPMPKVNQERGIICHLPASGGPCTLYWIELRPDLLDLALNVRELRRTKFQTAFDVPEVTNSGRATADLLVEAFPGTVVDGPETEALVERRRQRLLASLPADVKDKWQAQLHGIRGPKAADTWTNEQMDAIERAFELPWTDEPAAPAVATETNADVVTLRPRPADDLGKKADANELKALRERARRQSNGVKAWVKGWNEEAIAEGTAWKMSTGPNVSLWSYQCSRAGLYLARIVERAESPESGLELVRRILATVLGEIAVAEGVTIGGLVGACSVDEATRLADLATELNTKQIEVAS
jgi:hypothetical protein